MKIRGPRTEPWGMPEVTGEGWDREEESCINYQRGRIETSNSFRLRNRMEWEMA